MTDLKFNYDAPDLIQPLRDLLARQTEKLAALQAEVDALPASVVEALHKPIDLMKTNGPTPEVLAARLVVAERDRLAIGQRETELWLFECLRFSAQSWELTLSDLALLYDRQTVQKALEEKASKPQRKRAPEAQPLPPPPSPVE